MNENSYQQITQEKAKEMMDSQEVIVLDVREQDEFDAGHIPGAVLLPVGTISKETAATVIPEPDSRIVQTVYSVLGEFLNVEEIPLCRTRGWSDAGVLSTFGKIPTVVFGPGALQNSHTKDEHIAIEQIYNFVSLYANIAAQFCGVAE